MNAKPPVSGLPVSASVPFHQQRQCGAEHLVVDAGQLEAKTRQHYVLQPGMVLVLEPVVWEDGTGGYRSEEILVITEEGWIKLTDYPYTPYGD
jgi:Xaa-Pro aminopeptidase